MVVGRTNAFVTCVGLPRFIEVLKGVPNAVHIENIIQVGTTIRQEKERIHNVSNSSAQGRSRRATRRHIAGDDTGGRQTEDGREIRERDQERKSS